jgi:ATP-dependent DNA helicase RecG
MGSTSIDVVDISETQRNAILMIEEGHFVDLKAVEISPAKLTRTISAFANSNGGELYVGIDDVDVVGVKVHFWRGFAIPEGANGHIQIFEQLFPLGQYFSYNFLRAPGVPGIVLQVEVRKTREILVASDGIAYIRRNAMCLPCKTPEELERLRLDKGLTTFETETVNAPVSIITNSIPTLEFLTRVIPTAEPEPWLTKQVFIVDGKPTVGGLLLFCEEPQAVLPKRCGVKIYRYKSSDPVGRRETLAFDPITVEGCIYDQIKSAVSETVKLIEQVQKLGTTGLENIRYPHETLHEIVTNAILHRDYSIVSDVHVRIFDNRVEVESPGRLPGHVTPDNILHEQLARNGAIVRMINKFPDPPNKDVGEGLNTAFSAMSRLRLKPPTIVETETSVIFNIRHEPLASPDESVMAYLETNPEIVNRIGRQITGIQSENSMKSVFYRMRDRGMIEPVPGKEGFLSAWRKKQTSESDTSEC